MTIPVIKMLSRAINWIFAIGFLVFGLALLVTPFKAGLIFIVVGILISPFLGDFLKKTIKIKFAPSTKLIIVLLGIVTAIVSLKNYETDEQRLLVGIFVQDIWLDYDDEKQISQLQAYFDREKFKKRQQAYLARREELLTGLLLLYENHYYQAVINQGRPYVKFEPQIKQWVESAKKTLRKQHIEMVIKKVPQLIKAGKYAQAYQLAAPLNVPELQKLVEKAKKLRDKEVAKLRRLYERGSYNRVIKKGKSQVEFDCQIKRLVLDSKKAKEIQKLSKLIAARNYEKALGLASQSEFSEYPKFKVIIKKAQEKKIRAKLRRIPVRKTEANLREYAKLVKLFPDNKKYQKKLEYYGKRLAKRIIQPPLVITQNGYGDKWPFAVHKGELECQPPGIVTFKVNNKIYAVNDLASRLASLHGYKNLEDIWRNKPDKLPKNAEFIINKGLELCHPTTP